MMNFIKRIFCFFLCMSLTPICAFGEEQEVKYIYVSVFGDDNNVDSDNANDRVLTLEGAKQRFLYLKEQYPQVREFEIVFEKGIYSFDKSVEFTKDDMENVDSLTIKSEDGAAVEFTGSKKIPVSAFEKIIDSEVSSKLENSENVYCVDLKNVGITEEMIGELPEDLNSYRDNILYVDGEKQNISQWPNGRYSYAVFEKTAETEGTFYYTEDRLSKAVNERDAYIGGYLNYDYVYAKRKLKSVDVENKTITVSGDVSSTQSKRFKIFNSLQELDVPGEYYIDRDNLILYYYPKGELKEREIELSVFDDVAVKLYGASNIHFEGITFTRLRNGAIYVRHEQGNGWNKDKIPQGSDNGSILNCSFNNMGGKAIEITGSALNDFLGRDYYAFDVNKPYSAETYGSARFGGGKNWRIENNLFYELDETAISDLSGGNEYELEKTGHMICNNYFSGISLEFPSNPALRIYSIGTKIYNNLFHNIGGQVIVHNGFEHEIKYNEFSNTLKEVQDAGVIYAGRNIIRRGGEISYNLIKDFLPVGICMNPNNKAIYYDDGMCGQSAHHNMIADGDKAITYSGSSGEIYANVVVDTINGLVLMPYEGAWTEKQRKKYLHWVNGQEACGYDDMPEETYALWNEEYPSIMNEYNYWQKSIIDGNEVVEGIYVNVYDNLTVGYKNTIDERFEKREGSNDNNTVIDAFSDFVDYSNYDLRIKSNADILQTNGNLLTEDNFEMESIGIQNEEVMKRIAENKDFDLKYPCDNQIVNVDEEITFLWENASCADKYKIEISKNQEFTEIVEEGVTYNNSYTVKEPDKTCAKYFWRVRAFNETRTMKSEWQSESVNTFLTNAEDIYIKRFENYALVEIPEKMAGTTKIYIENGDKVSEYEYFDETKIKIDISDLPENTVIRIETYDNGVTYKRTFDMKEFYNLEIKEILDDFSENDSGNWKYSKIKNSQVTEYDAQTSEKETHILNTNALYQNLRHQNISDGEFEMHITNNSEDGFLKGLLQIVRGSNMAVKDNLFYMKGYGVSYAWGNVQLVKLDGESVDLKTAIKFKNDAVLDSKAFSTEYGKEYKMKIVTENLLDTGVRIQIFVQEASENYGEPLISYVDRTEPIFSGNNCIMTSDFSKAGDYELDNIRTAAYNSTDKFMLYDIVKDYGYRVYDSEGREVECFFDSGTKVYRLAGMSEETVKIQLYDHDFENCVEMIALYENGKLKEIKKADENFMAEMILPEIKSENDYELKAFIWSGTDTMVPVLEAIKIAE